MKETKAINLMLEKLFSDKPENVLFTLNKIRDSGDPNILAHVIKLLSTTNNPEIQKSIIGLLNDLKSGTSKTEIIKALKNDNYFDIRKQLLATCWQSSLNYSEYLAFFVDIFISSTFDVAFEAFTIIENIDEKYNAAEIDGIIHKLKMNLSESKNEKDSLIVELTHILEGKKM